MCMSSCVILGGSSSSTAMVPAVQHQIQTVSDDSETDLELLTGDEIGGGDYSNFLYSIVCMSYLVL